MHILMNMIPLFFFGRAIENIFGSKRLLLLYLGGAIFGGIFQLTLDSK
jgi:membrane associated rhomboid family serine protease